MLRGTKKNLGKFQNKSNSENKILQLINAKYLKIKVPLNVTIPKDVKLGSAFELRTAGWLQLCRAWESLGDLTPATPTLNTECQAWRTLYHLATKLYVVYVSGNEGEKKQIAKSRLAIGAGVFQVSDKQGQSKTCFQVKMNNWKLILMIKQLHVYLYMHIYTHTYIHICLSIYLSVHTYR